MSPMRRADRRPRVRLIHWKAEEAPVRLERLEELGYEAVDTEAFGPETIEALEQDPPAALVIDLGRLPSQGRELGVYLRHRRGTRGIPLVFVAGAPEKVARVRTILPDVGYAESWATIGPALDEAVSTPPADPVVPESVFESYRDVPTTRKLGIRKGFRVAVVGAPAAVYRALSSAAPGARFRRTGTGACDLQLRFVKSEGELARTWRGLAARTDIRFLWIAWRKRSAGARSWLTQQQVRKAGMERGWVDSKICSIDAEWAALRFTRRGTGARPGSSRRRS